MRTRELRIIRNKPCQPLNRLANMLRWQDLGLLRVRLA